MATLAALHLYPIKSCAGLSLERATLTRAGLMTRQIVDREWMLVDADGNFLTQRAHPRMALIAPRLAPHALEVGAPGMAPLELALARPDPAGAAVCAVRLWDDTLPAYDCGAAAAAWFTQFLGAPCKLVRFDPRVERLANPSWTGGLAAPTLFSDGYPLLVLSLASLADLNARLAAIGRAALPMNRFRPNLVIDGVDAFEEDYAAALRLGTSVLKPVKPCPRCPIPSVDQDSGLIGPDPLDVLRAYRAKPELDGAICFGMNCIVAEGGADEPLRVGQEIEVELAF
jgi:uncharacterized protein